MLIRVQPEVREYVGPLAPRVFRAIRDVTLHEKKLFDATILMQVSPDTHSASVYWMPVGEEYTHVVCINPRYKRGGPVIHALFHELGHVATTPHYSRIYGGDVAESMRVRERFKNEARAWDWAVSRMKEHDFAVDYTHIHKCIGTYFNYVSYVFADYFGVESGSCDFWRQLYLHTQGELQDIARSCMGVRWYEDVFGRDDITRFIRGLHAKALARVEGS